MEKMFITDVSEMLKFQSNHLLNFYSNLKPILYLPNNNRMCVYCVFIVCGKFPNSLIKKTVRVTGLVFSVKCRYNPDEAKW